MSRFQKLLRDQAIKSGQQAGQISSYRLAKELRNFRKGVLRTIRDVFLIVLGILSAGLGLKSFLLPNDFIDGGATGISLLINELTNIPLSILLIVVNLPFILIGYRQMGKMFSLRAFLAIVGLALCVAFVPYPVATTDKLLVSVFGGFFLGLGIGLAVRGGAVLDGTEVMAIYFSRKSSMTIGDVILLFNIILFSVAAWLLNFETALYSIMIYLVASKTVDFVIEGIEEYTGVTIISVKHAEIAEMISQELGAGLTIYKGQRGYGKTGLRQEYDIIYTVITRLEISKLTAEVEKIDPNAFVVMNSIKDTRGGMIKKRPLS